MIIYLLIGFVALAYLSCESPDLEATDAMLGKYNN